jgi:hypothetical protein
VLVASATTVSDALAATGRAALLRRLNIMGCGAPQPCQKLDGHHLALRAVKPLAQPDVRAMQGRGRCAAAKDCRLTVGKMPEESFKFQGFSFKGGPDLTQRRQDAICGELVDG